MISKKLLQNFKNISKIITGKVYGLNSKVIQRFDGVIENYDEPVLIKDIKGELQSNHIKIQYFNKVD